MSDPSDLVAHTPSVSNPAQKSRRVRELEISSSSLWAGPLPPPEMLIRYNEAFPGCAERIVAMAEQQSLHRQSLESVVIGGNVYSQKVGLVLGFVLALIVFISAAWLLYEGKVVWSAGFFIGDIVALVSVFVLGKRDQNKQLSPSRQEDRQQTLPFPEA